MQVRRFGVAAACLLVAAVAPAFGQRVQVQPAQVQPKGILIRGGAQALLTPDAVAKLKLTAEQNEKYTKIETEFKDKAKASQDKFREDIKALRDREKFKELNEKLQADGKKLREDHLAKVEPILTADQKAIFKTVKDEQPGRNPGIRPIQPIGGGGVGQILPPGLQQRLQLTEDQKKQIADIQKEVEAKILKVLDETQRKQYEDLKKNTIRPIRPAQPIQPNIRNPRPAVQPPAPARNKD